MVSIGSIVINSAVYGRTDFIHPLTVIVVHIYSFLVTMNKILRSMQQNVLLVCLFFALNTKGTPVLNEGQNFHPLIVNGSSEVDPNEFPWQVSLRTNLNNLHYCSGVIVDYGTILTTGACAELTSPYLTTVVAGNLNMTLSNTSDSQQIVQVTSVHIHPNYADSTDYSNNIAVLKVNPAFTMTENVAPVPTLQSSYLVPAELAIISGWGSKREEEISLQTTLQKATVKLIQGNQDCQKIIDDDLNITLAIEDSMICITAPGTNSNVTVDSCTGDEGGPLIIYEGESPVLVGLISFGIGCGRPEMPSFCVRVSPYIDFIGQYQESK